MKKIVIGMLSLFLISGCATSKHTRELRRKSKDCNCPKQNNFNKNKAYKSYRR